MHTSNNLRILYYNARSLLPKLDELHISIDSHQPDVICITESWLCSNIQDSEILIPGYQSLRHDRNRSGGGVLMYIAQHFIVKQLPSHPSLKLLTVTYITKIAENVCHCFIVPLAHQYMKFYVLSIVI